MKSRLLVPVGLVVAAALLTACSKAQPTKESGYGQAGTVPVTADQATTPPPQTAATTAPPATALTHTADPAPPTGPQIITFEVTSQPSCPAGTNLNPIQGRPAMIEWKAVGAQGVDLSVDGPGLYGSYGLIGSETLNFPCDGTPGSYQTHTYTVTTVGGGAAQSKTLTVKAKINDIAQV
jgi:hypothetical protein